jgi:ketosteroid isomerase-like protein
VSHSARFAEYAAAFEKAYAENDWSLVEDYFTEDAVYDSPLPPPIGGLFEGRDAVLASFDDVLNRFDRRFDSRAIELLEGPREEGDSVWVRGRAIYRSAGVPDFAFELEETAWFEGDRIRRLEDRYEGDAIQGIVAYLEAHGESLGIHLGE